MGLFKSPQEKAVNLFEKHYREELPRLMRLRTDQGNTMTEQTLMRAHQNAVVIALGRVRERGYRGLDDTEFMRIYWPVALSQYEGRLQG